MATDESNPYNAPKSSSATDGGKETSEAIRRPGLPQILAYTFLATLAGIAGCLFSCVGSFVMSPFFSVTRPEDRMGFAVTGGAIGAVIAMFFTYRTLYRSSARR